MRRRESRSDRSGFTLVELLVTVVLSTLILGSIYQVLVTNQRISALQSERVLGQQTVRAGLDVLAQDLREASASGGDLLVMDDDRVQFRALRSFGLACTVVSNVPPTVTVAYEGNAFAVGDQLYVFGDGSPTSTTDDQWFSVLALAVVDGQTCGTDNVPAQRISLSGPLTAAAVNTIRQGAIVRAWEAVTYTTGVVDGDIYLVRTVGTDTARLVGPLQEGGLSFEYLDAAGDATAVGTNVRRVGVTLRVASDVRDEQGDILTDSLTTSVFLRN